jgi:hypothetical protein
MEPVLLGYHEAACNCGGVGLEKQIPIFLIAHLFEKSASGFADTSIHHLPQNLGKLALPLVRAQHLLQESPRMVHGEQP